MPNYISIYFPIAFSGTVILLLGAAPKWKDALILNLPIAMTILLICAGLASLYLQLGIGRLGKLLLRIIQGANGQGGGWLIGLALFVPIAFLPPVERLVCTLITSLTDGEHVFPAFLCGSLALAALQILAISVLCQLRRTRMAAGCGLVPPKR